MYKDVVYSSGFVSIKEQDLADKDRIERMIKAVGINATLMVLLDCGYDRTILTKPSIDVDLLLSTELERTIEFFDTYCTDQSLRVATLLRYDYHNAKVLYKARYCNISMDRALYPAGTLDLATLTQSLESGEYESLPPLMAEALYDLDGLSTSSMAQRGNARSINGREIDVTLDKAMAKDIANHAKNIKNQEIRQYFSASADICNIMIALRAKKIGFSYEQALEQFVAGGAISFDSLLIIYEGNIADIQTELLGSEYLEIVERMFRSAQKGEGLDEGESALIDLLLFKGTVGRLNTFTDQPLFAWYLQRLAEFKLIRLILVAKANGMGEDVIRRRLGGLYA